MEQIEGASGKVYTPKEYNRLWYESLQQVSLEKDRESAARKSQTGHIGFLAKEFRMSKDSVKKWFALKLEETSKGTKTFEEAVEIDRELKHNRELYGESSDLESRIEAAGTLSVEEAYEAGILEEEE